MGDESIPKKKEIEIDPGKVRMRKIAGILALIVGIPNFLIGVALTLSGVGAVIALVIMGIQLYTTEPPDNICGPALIALLIILVIIALVLAIIFTIISFIFAIGVAGQTVGGYYGLRGLRYNRAIALTLIGSLVSLLTGIGMLIAGLSMKDGAQWVKVVALIWGAYDIFAFFVTMTGMVMFVMSKETFVEPEKKPKKKKKDKQNKKKKKVQEKDKDEEDWDS